MRSCKKNPAYSLITKRKRTDGRKGHVPDISLCCRHHLGDMVERCIRARGSVRVFLSDGPGLCEINVE